MFDLNTFALGFHSSHDGMVVGSPVLEPVPREEPLPESPILDMIYAPDPLTGVPRSDMAFLMSKDRAPEVAQFIKDTLQRPLGNSGGIDDADLALDSTMGYNETLKVYAARLQKLCENESKSS